MPFRVTIPDVCDRFGCSITEATDIIVHEMKIERSSPKLLLPTPFQRTVTYRDKNTDETRAVVEYYIEEPRWLKEDEDTKS